MARLVCLTYFGRVVLQTFVCDGPVIFLNIAINCSYTANKSADYY